MNKLPFLIATIFTLSILLIPTRAQADNDAFQQAMNSARYWEERKMSSEAMRGFAEAVKKAQTDAERAEAQLGVARNTQIRYGKPDPATDGNLKITNYRKVLELPEAPATARAEAYLGIGQTQAALLKYDDALASLKLAAEMAGAPAAQQRKAQLWSGEILIEAKRYDQARARLRPLTIAPEADDDEKLAAHRAIARSYLLQNNLADGLAEITKLNTLPDLKDDQRADIYIANGDMLADAGHYKAARAEYEKVAVLPDAAADKNLMARFNIGQAYFRESAYGAAVEVWTVTADMRGAEKFAPQIWRSVGLAYLGDKKYDKSRDAYQKWLALPDIGVLGIVQAWQHVANSYVQEKEYAKAREALGNIGKLAPPGATSWDKLQLKLRQQFDIADVYRAEADFTKTGAVYTAILVDVPVGGAYEPPFYYEARDLVWKAADDMAKDKASMDTAYALYEALEKLYPYEFNDARAYLAMGDILVAQGKPAEAKTKYQRVTEIRKNYDEAKIAAEKIKKLEAL